MRFAAGVLALSLASGCGAKAKPPAPAPPPAVDLAPADALFDAGCYTCLEKAFELYDRGRQAPSASRHARDRAFATAVLLAAREKEIGLAATPWLGRAAAIAEADERIYVDITASLAWTNTGAPDFEAPRSTAAARTDWIAFLDPAASKDGASSAVARRHPLLDQYLLIALRCVDGGRRAADELEKRIDSGRPALKYRLGLCSAAQRSHLEAVLATDPRFVEASFFIGRYEMSTGVMPAGGSVNRAWLSTSVKPLLVAHEGLPQAPVIATVFASLMRSRTELRRALELYDRALAVRPAQRDALLGRTITLTYLSRRDEAIASATRMIELGTWYVGDAYYWRALNRYHRTQLDLAAADIATAKKLLFNDDVMTLSGIIAYDQQRPVDARRDFVTAISINVERCTAQWYLGILDLDESAWTNAVPRFAIAGDCFQRAAESAREEVKQLPPDLPEDARQQQLAGFAESIDSSIRQAGRSFLNAAQAAMRLNDRNRALGFARTASRFDEVKERADALVRSLEQPAARGN